MALYDPIYGYPAQPTIQFPQQPMAPVQPVPQQTQQIPFVQIVTVDGESSAKGLKLAAGSTLLASDEKESIIWFIKANDVGPNTVYPIPFDPSIFSGGSSAMPDLSTIESRLSSIEERMTRYESNAEHDKQAVNNTGNNSNRR